MGALQALEAATDADALRAALTAAKAHAGVLPALDEEVSAATTRLEALELAAPAPPPAAAPAAAAAASHAAVELELDDLRRGTSDFGASEMIGEGGFACVFRAAGVAALPDTPLAIKKGQRVAVTYDLRDLKREVRCT